MTTLQEITVSQISQLAELRLNLNHLYYLLHLLKGHTPNLPTVLQALERKHLVAQGKITEEGKQLLKALEEDSGESVKEIGKVETVSYKDAFSEWWEAYPRNGSFEYKGKKFQLGRPLRIGKKSELEEKYMKILLSGKYTHEQLLNALKCEVLQRKKDTLKKGLNQFQYMKGAATYLNQEAYEAFIGDVCEEEVEKELVNPVNLF